jgi:hypothetical protein
VRQHISSSTITSTSRSTSNHAETVTA